MIAYLWHYEEDIVTVVQVYWVLGHGVLGPYALDVTSRATVGDSLKLIPTSPSSLSTYLQLCEVIVINSSCSF